MEQPKNIYQRAGEWGFPFGLYLACTGATSIFADWFMPLGALFFVLLLGTPLVVYWFQRRKFIENGGFGEYAELWMLGILLFILGTVVANCIIFLLVHFVRPNFMYEQARMVIDAYRDIPEMRDSDMVRVLQRMVDERLMPSPIETVFNAFWFTTFGGSILSAVTAVFARRTYNPKRKR